MALVVIDLVPVITSLVAALTLIQVRAGDAVAARRNDAVVTTRIVIGFVGVITGLIARLTFADIGSDDPIAAARRLTAVEATIYVDLV
jgi:uncharacterized membrane protein